MPRKEPYGATWHGTFHQAKRWEKRLQKLGRTVVRLGRTYVLDLVFGTCQSNGPDPRADPGIHEHFAHFRTSADMIDMRRESI